MEIDGRTVLRRTAHSVCSLITSDVLLTDGSSIMMDYLLTGKPIIYCHKEKDKFTPLGQILYRGVYVANSWEDVEKYLGDLRQGIDPLKEERQVCRETLIPVRKVSAGETIKEILKKDYHETRS